MEQIIYYAGLVLFSIVAGLIGIFYRNCLKMPNMIFSGLYRAFEKMVVKNRLMRFIAYPLGYCIYCSTTWIAIIGFGIVYSKVSIDVLIPISISHYVVMYFCKHYSNLEGFNPVAKDDIIKESDIREVLGMDKHDFILFKEYMKKLKS